MPTDDNLPELVVEARETQRVATEQTILKYGEDASNHLLDRMADALESLHAEVERLREDLELCRRQATAFRDGMAEKEAVLADRDAQIAEALAQRLDHGAQGNGYAQLVERMRAILSRSPRGAADRAEVVTICGSTKFKAEILAEVARLTTEGKLVISLGVFGHTDLPDYDWTTDASDLKRMLDALHRQKIDMADRVHVVDVGGYYGESMAREIEYARSLGKPVTFMVGARAEGEPTATGAQP